MVFLAIDLFLFFYFDHRILSKIFSMDEDWDAEIEGTALPIKQFQEVKINSNNDSSKYFADDYHNQQNDDHIGFGSHISFEGKNRGGRGRGRGRGYDR